MIKHWKVIKKEESPDLQPMPTLSDEAEEKVKKKKQERKY